MSTLIEMKYDLDDFADLLVAADRGAATGWEMDFIKDVQDRFALYGERLYVSEKQLDVLRRIAKV